MSFYEILSLTVALSMLFFGACIFIYKLFTLSFKEIKQMLKKPTFIFTIITFLFIAANFFIRYFFSKDLFYDNFAIPLITIPFTAILISQALSSFIVNMKSKLFSWILTIFLGIGSYYIFVFLFGILTPDYYDSRFKLLYNLMKYGEIIPIVSLIINVVERVRIKKNIELGKKIDKMNKKDKIIVLTFTIIISSFLFIVSLYPISEYYLERNDSDFGVSFSLCFITLVLLSVFVSLFFICFFIKEKSPLCKMKITCVFSIISVLAINSVPYLLKISYQDSDNINLIFYISAITSILISRALTILTKNIKIKYISWLSPIIFGFVSFLLFLSMIALSYGKVDTHGYYGVKIGYGALFSGIIVWFISLTVNIFEKKRQEVK